MNSPRVALVVDHPRRDLAALVLTAYELCQQGVTCHLVPFNLRREIWALAPDFVLLNYLRGGANEDLGRQLVKAGIPFGVLDTEGGVWPSLGDYTEILWGDAALLKKASLVCAWGPELAQYTIQHGFFLPEQVTVTGCPRFDLYNPAWRCLVGNGDRATAGRTGHRILVNTNYSNANPGFKSSERQREILEGLGWKPARVSSLLEAEREAIRSFIELVRRLSADYPEIQILLRPHPFENPELYRKELEGLPNVEVNASGPVQSQIFNASVVIQQSCTTGAEAVLAGVPTVSPQWFPAPYPIPLVERMSVPAASYADLNATLDSIFAGRYRPSAEQLEAIDPVIRNSFHRIDGLSHKRVADSIRGRLASPREVDERLCAEFLYGVRDPGLGLLSRLLGRGRYALGLSPDWSFRRMRVVPSAAWSRSDKFFDASEVRQLTARIEDSVPSQARVEPVRVASARERGDYHHGYRGFAVTMSRKGPGQRGASPPAYGVP